MMTTQEKRALNVLLVDDSDVDSFVIAETLQESKFDLKLNRFDSPSKAIGFFNSVSKKEDYPDVLLLDLNLPIMDGYEFLDELDEIIDLDEGDPFHIFVLTSSIHARDLEKLEKYPVVTRFMNKPLEVQTFDEFLYEVMQT